jgi:hypothetical protein
MARHDAHRLRGVQWRTARVPCLRASHERPMTASEPYIDKRNARKPFAVTVRHGATNSLVTIHRFAKPGEAWEFYRSKTAN